MGLWLKSYGADTFPPQSQNIFFNGCLVYDTYEAYLKYRNSAPKILMIRVMVTEQFMKMFQNCAIVQNGAIDPGGLRACVRHAQLGHGYYHRSVFLSSFFFLRLLLLTHFGETPVCEIIVAPIFWHNQKIYAKKIKLGG